MTKTITEKKLTAKDIFLVSPVLLLAAENPKKKGSMSYDRFQGYFTLEAQFNTDIQDGQESGYTVQDALDAGLRMDDIRHDSAHGFIKIG